MLAKSGHARSQVHDSMVSRSTLLSALDISLQERLERPSAALVPVKGFTPTAATHRAEIQYFSQHS